MLNIYFILKTNLIISEICYHEHKPTGETNSIGR